MRHSRLGWNVFSETGRQFESVREMLRGRFSDAKNLFDWDDRFAFGLLDRIAKAAGDGGMDLLERVRLGRKLYRISRRAEVIHAAQGLPDA